MSNGLDALETQQQIMVPDGTVVWDAYTFPNLNGRLFVSSGCTDVVFKNVIALAANQPYALPNAIIHDIDDNRALLSQDDVMYKVSYRPATDQINGLSGLQANVTLAKALSQFPEPGHDDDGIGPHYYAAPTQHAAFISFWPKRARTVWAMSLETGHNPDAFEVPTNFERSRHIFIALGNCGLTAADVNLDDYKQNLLVSYDLGKKMRRIVKIDVLATHDYQSTGIIRSN